MKFWLPIAWAETDQLIDIARFAEEVGFHGLMSADHALYPGQLAPDYPYTDNGLPPQTAESEYPDCWVSIAAMAAVTKKLHFTTGVYVLPLRNPIEVAKATATLAIMTGGRFILGAGSGWMKEEFDVYGVDFHTRGKRMTETVEVLQKLWRGGMVEHHGNFFDFSPLQLSPALPQPVPIYFGGDAPVALARCAQYGDGWIGRGNALDEVPTLLQTLRDLRRQYGRDHLPFETLVGLRSAPALDDYRRLQNHGVSSGLAWPFAYVLGMSSSLDQKKVVMEKFANEVIRHFN